MGDKTYRRFLVEWTERATYRDIAYVDVDAARESLHMSVEAWEALGDEAQLAMLRVFMNGQDSVHGLGGTERWKVVDRTGFDVLVSVEWPADTEEPSR